jgi:hypothetical protein
MTNWIGVSNMKYPMSDWEATAHEAIRSLPTADQRMYAAGHLHHLIGGIPAPLDNPRISAERMAELRAMVAALVAADPAN